MNWSGEGFEGNFDVIMRYFWPHLRITLAALAIGTLLSFPIAYVGYRWPRLYPAILSTTTVLYTIPSLAMFVFLYQVLDLGLNSRPVIVGLSIYTMVVLVRNIVEGLRSVPAHVRDAATAMGYRRLRRLVAVELPLAVPAIVAGLRVAAVSTISLVSVGGLLGQGALGQLFIDGFKRDIPNEVLAGIVASILLAVALDLVIVTVQRLATPWARAGGR